MFVNLQKNRIKFLVLKTNLFPSTRDHFSFFPIKNIHINAILAHAKSRDKCRMKLIPPTDFTSDINNHQSA